MRLTSDNPDRPARRGSRPAAIRRVFVVDGHPMVRRGVADLISRQPDLLSCGEAGNGPLAGRQIELVRPDLIIMEISLPLGNGLDLVRRVRALDEPAPRTLVYSMHDELLFAERALRAGAHGYLQKKAPASSLLRAVRTVLAGGIWVSQGVSNRVLGRGDRLVDRPDDWPVEKLTDRELQVLLLLGQGLGSREIADRLILSIKTINTYTEHLKAKLDLRSHSALVHFAVVWSLSSSPGTAAAVLRIRGGRTGTATG